jgi:phosphoribosylaminoimidazole-succinocarboxamide synthase
LFKQLNFSLPKDREITKAIANQFSYHFKSLKDGEAKKRLKLPSTSQINSAISVYFFEYLNGFNIPTYYSEKDDLISFLVKSNEQFPFNIVIRNVAVKEFAKKYEFSENTVLETPVIDFYLTDKRFKDLLINESYLSAYGILQPEEVKLIIKYVSKINAVLKSFFLRRNLSLNELELRFTKVNEHISLAGEFTPDSMIISEKGLSGKFKYNFSDDYHLAFYEHIIGF